MTTVRGSAAALPGAFASRRVLAAAVRSICDPAEDLRGDVEYKTAMAAEMCKRAIRAAAARCA